MPVDRSQTLVDSKVSRFLLKLRGKKRRNPQLEESVINKVAALEGREPSRHIYVKK